MNEILLKDTALDHEYLPITGLPEFTSAAARLLFSPASAALKEGRVSRCVANELITGDDVSMARDMHAMSIVLMYYLASRQFPVQALTTWLRSSLQSFTNGTGRSRFSSVILPGVILFPLACGCHCIDC